MVVVILESVVVSFDTLKGVGESFNVIYRFFLLDEQNFDINGHAKKITLLILYALLWRKYSFMRRVLVFSRKD